MMMMMFLRLRPNIAAITIISGMSGMTRKMSVIRISTTSMMPPKNPEITPTAPPISIATRAAANPTSSDTRVPAISSESMSTPPSSVPSQWAELGGA